LTIASRTHTAQGELVDDRIGQKGDRKRLRGFFHFFSVCRAKVKNQFMQSVIENNSICRLGVPFSKHYFDKKFLLESRNFTMTPKSNGCIKNRKHFHRLEMTKKLIYPAGNLAVASCIKWHFTAPPSDPH
jgi:hypothetical protein